MCIPTSIFKIRLDCQDLILEPLLQLQTFQMRNHFYKLFLAIYFDGECRIVIWCQDAYYGPMLGFWSDRSIYKPNVVILNYFKLQHFWQVQFYRKKKKQHTSNQSIQNKKKGYLILKVGEMQPFATLQNWACLVVKLKKGQSFGTVG